MMVSLYFFIYNWHSVQDSINGRINLL